MSIRSRDSIGESTSARTKAAAVLAAWACLSLLRSHSSTRRLAGTLNIFSSASPTTTRSTSDSTDASSTNIRQRARDPHAPVCHDVGSRAGNSVGDVVDDAWTFAPVTLVKDRHVFVRTVRNRQPEDPGRTDMACEGHWRVNPQRSLRPYER